MNKYIEMFSTKDGKFIVFDLAKNAPLNNYHFTAEEFKSLVYRNPNDKKILLDDYMFERIRLFFPKPVEPCPCDKNGYKNDPRVYMDNGTWRCEWCGARHRDAKWKFICKTCDKEATKLYGLFVPHLCLGCYQKTRADMITRGDVCGNCRKPHIDCYC